MNIKEIPSKYIRKVSKCGKTKIFNSMTNLLIYDKETNSKIQNLMEARINGFIIYKKETLLRFIEGGIEIKDYVKQFILLHEFYQTYGSAHCLRKFILLYGPTLGKIKNKERIEHNPWKNHDGKYSPFSKKCPWYSKESIKKASQNRTYNTTVDYYIKRGYSLEESIKLRTERQRTFSLDKCIKKYGKEIGLQVFKTRQEKWLNTLNNKSDIEKERINRLKGTGRSNYVDNKPCNLYYVKFYSGNFTFYKVGITHFNIEKRFPPYYIYNKHNLKYELIIFKHCKTGVEAFNLEQRILNEYERFRVFINYKGFKTYEAFKKNIFKRYKG